MAAFEAYIDESASEKGERELILAAYVHRSETWVEFAADWRAALEATPRIAHFHMVEAEHLRGQFGGWSKQARDSKVELLVRVIEKYDPWSVSVRLSVRSFERLLAPIVPFDLRHPYLYCFSAMLSSIARLHAHLRLTGTIDCIFDRRSGVGPLDIMFHRASGEDLTPEARALLGAPPVFRDCREVPPLQAADMLVWHIRRVRETRNQTEARPLLSRLPGPIYAPVVIDEQAMTEIAKQMASVPNVEMTRGRRGSIRKVLAWLLKGSEG